MIRLSKLRLLSNYLKIINNSSKCRPLSLTTSFCGSNTDTDTDAEEFNFKRDSYPKSKSVTKQLLLQKDSSAAEEKLSNFELMLKRCRNSEDVLQAIEKTNMRLTEEELTRTCSYLFDAIKKEGPSLSKKSVLSSIGMQKFSKYIRETCRHCDGADLISFLKLFVYLEAPSADFTFQMILRLISTQMNSFSLANLIYIDFLMERMSEECKSPLSMAVHLALPMIFESQLELQIEGAETHALTDYFGYAAKFNLSEKSITVILNCLNAKIAKFTKPFTVHQALGILWGLCDLQFYSNSQEILLKKVYSTIVENVAFIKTEQLSRSLLRISKKFFKDNIAAFYNEDFLNTVCCRLADPKTDVTTLFYSMSRVSKMRHINIEYLDRLAEVLHSNPTHLINNERTFINLVRIFSMANYKPEKWKYLEPIFLQHPSLSSTSSLSSMDHAYQEVGLALDLLALDLFPEELLQRIFSIDYLMNIVESANFSNNLLLLTSTLKHLYPDRKDIAPPPSLVQKWIDKSKRAQAHVTSHIKGALERGIGGENYVVSGIFNEGIFIDHAIVMRKGGYPIAINVKKTDEDGGGGDKNEPILFQDIEMPSESFAVLVKIFRRGAYATNTNRLRGIHSLEVKVIERFGHPLVVIDLEKWQELNDHEKIPFLMQKIREKSDKNSSNDYYS